MYLPTQGCVLSRPSAMISTRSSLRVSANFTQLALDSCHVNNSAHTTSLSPFLARLVTTDIKLELTQLSTSSYRVNMGHKNLLWQFAIIALIICSSCGVRRYKYGSRIRSLAERRNFRQPKDYYSANNIPRFNYKMKNIYEQGKSKYYKYSKRFRWVSRTFSVKWQVDHGIVNFFQKTKWWWFLCARSENYNNNHNIDNDTLLSCNNEDHSVRCYLHIHFSVNKLQIQHSGSQEETAKAPGTITKTHCRCVKVICSLKIFEQHRFWVFSLGVVGTWKTTKAWSNLLLTHHYNPGFATKTIFSFLVTAHETLFLSWYQNDEWLFIIMFSSDQDLARQFRARARKLRKESESPGPRRSLYVQCSAETPGLAETGEHSLTRAPAGK